MMNFILLQLTFLILLPCTGFSQGGWSAQTSGIYTGLLSVHFLNANTGVCSGRLGKVVKTTNGGLNWEVLNTNSDMSLFSIWMLDSNLIIACGKDRTVLRTTNGGENWTRITAIADGFDLTCVEFLNSTTGYITSWGGVLLRSTNAGLSWFDIWHPYVLSEALTSISFADELTGYVAGDGAFGSNFSPFMKTTNGGLNWLRPIITETQFISDIDFVSPEDGVVVGAFPSVHITTNGGTSWISNHSLPVNTYFQAVDYVDREAIYAVGTNGAIIKSTNGGSNWFLQNYSTGYHLNDVSFVSDNTGYAVGDLGTILKTTTGGVVGIGGEVSEIADYELYQNYPNPFNPRTIINYELRIKNFIVLKVYDIAGKEVVTLVNDIMPAGKHAVEFNATDLSSGVYIYSLNVDGKQMGVRRMTLIK
jgi:photosystem II stability/assembly factor-like uncharacterized protein